MKRKFKTQFDKRPVKDEQWPCDDMREGDGIDPRFESESRKVSNRKALQLCSQVKESLDLTLSQCADGVLRDLSVNSVVPAPVL